ncbi:MAG: tyrosine-type recombinase/integrase, partial [Caldisericia bacterium]|nr:tyrosine-type recombinase/integrase [Caldisericia bacterium]
MAEGWCTLKPNEKVITLGLRTRILRGFAKYLKTIGKEAYIIPDGFVGKREQFLPYLYTKDQLKTFFVAADMLPPHKLSPMREYVIPVLFRILYCCGLRPQEVRHLRVTDVDLTNGTLCIVNSKRNKDRIVAMSTDLTSLCRSYDEIISNRFHSRDFFFENPNGGEYSATWIQQQFFK